MRRGVTSVECTELRFDINELTLWHGSEFEGRHRAVTLGLETNTRMIECIMTVVSVNFIFF
jgi:hypothetical protein